MIENIHKVGKAQWKKWCEAARYVFNEMMAVVPQHSYGIADNVRDGFGLGDKYYTKHLQMIQWNAAFNAACIVNEAVKENGADK